jgi:hypothetical protein
MSTRLYRNLFQYITKYAPNLTTSHYFLFNVSSSDHHPFCHRSPNFLPEHDIQVAVHKTVEVDVDLPHMDEEQLRSFKQTVSMRSQAELEIMAAELQMKSDLQI